MTGARAKQDDPAKSQKFIDVVREAETTDDEAVFERALKASTDLDIKKILSLKNVASPRCRDA